MLFTKNKLDKDLEYFLDNNCYKTYRVLIKYEHTSNSILKKISHSGGLIYHLLYSKIICANLTSKLILRLIEYPEVKYITFDQYLFLCGMSVSTANNVSFKNKFNLSGNNIGIGLIDSGVYPHPDLTTPSNRIHSFTDLINNISYPYDDNGHGTCIAGIICSNGQSSNSLYRGIAPHAKLYCYKAFDAHGKGFASSILFALENLISNHEELNLKVLCLPFELLSPNVFITKAFNLTFLEAIKNNIVPIIASGSIPNDSNFINSIPALTSCITVGGIDISNSYKPYKFSSCGYYKKIHKPDLSATATNITSLNSDTKYISEKDGQKIYPNKLDAKYKTFSGTSLSTAFISGICALLYENNKDLSFKDIQSLLKLACNSQDLNKENIGEGFLDLSKLPI
ncbi:MAG: peptidase [Clostridium sp.]|nr:peptidase [Clostridium sp.]